MIGFYEYLRDLPKLVSRDGGVTWNSGGLDARHLTALHELVCRFYPEGGEIIETGAGNSTISFLLSRPSTLTSTCSDQSTLDRIKSYCRTNEIPCGCFEHLSGRSEWVLGEIAHAGRQYDIALISENHGWPTVFVNFFHLYYMLKQGSFLILDDIQLHSVKELGRMLVSEPAKVALIQQIDKIAIFQKITDDRYFCDQGHQTYICDMSQRIASRATLFDLSH